MATTDSNFFEIQRRAYQWNRYSTLDDGVSPLVWDNDPTVAVAGRTAGEDKLISMPIGAFFIRSNGELYYKNVMPNNWGKVSSTTVANGNIFQSYSFTDSLEWVVNHGKNTRIFNETLFDISGNKFFAPVNIIDSNSFRIRLTSAASGDVHVLFPIS